MRSLVNEQSRSLPRAERRAVIVDGLRTPFVKAGGVFRDMNALHLASFITAELLARLSLPSNTIDAMVYGQVVPNVEAPNIAREVVIASGLSLDVDAFSVSRACATGTQALVEGARLIESGEADAVLCGGVDSLSQPPITFSRAFVRTLMAAQSAKTPVAKLSALMKLRPSHFKPQLPGIKELSTGLSMGESAEHMAKLNKIDRKAQDELSLRSHQRAAKAWDDGHYKHEVLPMPVAPAYKEVIDRDDLVRADTSMEKLTRLRPVFDRAHGTVTAGNSSPLTDGASVVLLMAAEKASSLGLESLAWLRSWGFAALDPAWQLLLGPSFAVPLALKRAGMALADVDYIDMHEAFAAQMLANIASLGSDTFAQEHLGLSAAVGEIDISKLNVFGGSISLGHPFAATGTRQALTMARALQRQGGGTALITQCAAGGLGAAVVLEHL